MSANYRYAAGRGCRRTHGVNVVIVADGARHSLPILDCADQALAQACAAALNQAGNSETSLLAALKMAAELDDGGSGSGSGGGGNAA